MPPSLSKAATLVPVAPPEPSISFNNNNDDEDEIELDIAPWLNNLLGLPNGLLAEEPTIDAQIEMLFAIIDQFEQDVELHAEEMDQPIAVLREKIEEMRETAEAVKWQISVMRMQLRTLLFSGAFCCVTMISICTFRLFTDSSEDVFFESFLRPRTFTVLVPSVSCFGVMSYLYWQPAKRYKDAPHNRQHQKEYIAALRLVNTTSLINIVWSLGSFIYTPVRKSWLSFIQMMLSSFTIKRAVDTAAVNVLSINLDVAL